MAKEMETPFKAPKRGLPWELIADFRMTAYRNALRGFLYVIREEFGADTALRLYERLCTMDDRIKNLTKTLLKIFQIKGTDAETWAQFWDIWIEICGFQATWLERSKTKSRLKVTKCPFQVGYKDISGWALIWMNIVNETINPQGIFERPKEMCAGDPYCEYIYKIEE
jgi:hypothetical protein